MPQCVSPSLFQSVKKQHIALLFAAVSCLLRFTRSAPTSTVTPSDHDAFFNHFEAPHGDIDAAVAPFLNHLYGDRTCPTELPKTGDQEQRSTCPWYYVINHDENRFPADIAEARCRCERCIGGHTVNQCERVFYHQRVLKRKGEKDGMYRWEPAWEKIATGCTCAVPATQTAEEALPAPVLD